jgi:hypothetical protein
MERKYEKLWNGKFSAVISKVEGDVQVIHLHEIDSDLAIFIVEPPYHGVCFIHIDGYGDTASCETVDGEFYTVDADIYENEDGLLILRVYGYSLPA